MQRLNKMKKQNNKREELKELNEKYKIKMEKLMKKKRQAEESDESSHPNNDGEQKNAIDDQHHTNTSSASPPAQHQHKNKKNKKGGDEFESKFKEQQNKKTLNNFLANNKNKIEIQIMNNSSLITCENCGLTMSHYAKITHDEKECEALFENYVFDGNTITPEIQRDEIKKILEETKLVKGRMHYVLSGKWWNLWKSYVQYDEDHKVQGSHPGPINNDDLIERIRKKRVPKKKESKEEAKTEKIEENGKEEKIDTPQKQPENPQQGESGKIHLFFLHIKNT